MNPRFLMLLSKGGTKHVYFLMTMENHSLYTHKDNFGRHVLDLINTHMSSAHLKESFFENSLVLSHFRGRDKSPYRSRTFRCWTVFMHALRTTSIERSHFGTRKPHVTRTIWFILHWQGQIAGITNDWVESNRGHQHHFISLATSFPVEINGVSSFYRTDFTVFVMCLGT